MRNFSEKRILITGATGGIGTRLAKDLDKLGAELILHGRNEEKMKELTFSLSKPHKTIIGDLREEEIRKQFLEIDYYDGVANCSGIIYPMPIKYLKEKHFDELFDVNLKSMVLLHSLLLRKKRINEMGSIVFLSSISANHPFFSSSLYSMSKKALETFSKSIAHEYASKKIRSNTVSPAMIDTEMYQMTKDATTDQKVAEYQKMYPFGIGKVEDVSSIITFLLSDESKWITGEDFKLDGGLKINAFNRKGL